MEPRISDAIVIIEPDQPGARPACIQERGETPILVLLLRQLLELGIDRVTLSVSRAHEHAVRPILAGHRGLPVCQMVAGPRQGPDSSAAAFYRCRRQLDASPLLVTRGSLLPEPGTWLAEMLESSASNAAVYCGNTPHAPSWACSVGLREGRIVANTPPTIDVRSESRVLSGTYALDKEFSAVLFRSLTSKREEQRREITLERAILEVLDEGVALAATKSEKTAWLCAEPQL
jgi:hypothetical protein